MTPSLPANIMLGIVRDETKEPKDRLDAFANELRAIEYWDNAYWKKGHRDHYERTAYLTRQDRRREIIRQVVAILQQSKQAAR